MVVDHALCYGRCMGPAKRQGEEGVGVFGCTNAHASHIGGWETDAPKTVSQVYGGNAGG